METKESNGLTRTGSQDGGISRQRKNTVSLDQKRRMRNLRKKRMRTSSTMRMRHKMKMKGLKSELNAAKEEVKKNEQHVVLLKHMSRTYWERWRWELEKRKEAVRINTPISQPKSPVVSEIDPSMLTDCDQRKELYIGRGSFGVVRLQMYRGIHVAVKELLPLSIKDDVLHEAQILAHLCHPYLPLLFGICTKTEPLRIVMQFHGFLSSDSLSLTLNREMRDKSIITTVDGWLMACAQILEAVNYLHQEAGVLHNDIKADNVLLGQTGSYSIKFQVVLIDFGKATSLLNGKSYHLSLTEKEQYRHKYPHIAPEVIEGESKQSTCSDMFSVGGLFYKIIDNGGLSSTAEKKRKLTFLAEQCRLVQYYRRYSARKALLFIQEEIS